MKDLYKEVAAYAEKLEKRIQKLEEVYSHSGEGSLKISVQKGKCRFSLRKRGPADAEAKVSYLSEKKPAERKLIREMAHKKYAYIVLPVLRKNIGAAREFLRIHSGQEELQMAERMHAEFQVLNSDIAFFPQVFAADWQQRAKEAGDPPFPEHLKQKTLRGEFVRSKSEEMIGNRLLHYLLQYRYEAELWLPGARHAVYPDFLILKPGTQETIIWEHFGKMDDPEYAEACIEKLNRYHEAGYVEGKNLIITMETQSHPLTSSMVDWAIRHWILGIDEAGRP